VACVSHKKLRIHIAISFPPYLPRPLQPGCYVEVFAGAGGTDCADFAGMLLRMYPPPALASHRDAACLAITLVTLLDMYTQWAHRRGCSADVVHATPCSVSSGYRHAVLKCTGDSAYGWLKGEAGVHRLVRISPYDELRRRHTSFAKIVIYPDVGDFEALSGGGGGGGGPSLTRDDVCIETFRSSGPGAKAICFQCEIVIFGQEVNTRRKRRAQ
jgi:peptide chain release factor 2